MKIQLYSDLHIEKRGFYSVPKLNSDIIILAGDIDSGMYGLEWAEELTRLHKKPVIYVAGNHEYYKHDFSKLNTEMKAFSAHYDYLIFLEKDEFIYENVRFLGTTLWTNYFHEQGQIERDWNIAKLDEALHDHRVIKIDGERFTASHAYKEHLKAEAWLREKLDEPFNGKTVVITHHAPSLMCNHADFGMNELSPGFVSDLNGLITKADLWCFGHTHSNLDTYIEGCRLVSNQLGYPRENIPEAFNLESILEL